MAGWSTGELSVIDRTDEPDLRSMRADGSLRDPVTMWVVRNGDDLYVRPVKGRDGWYQGTRTRPGRTRRRRSDHQRPSRHHLHLPPAKDRRWKGSNSSCCSGWRSWSAT
ncbi:DUF2255 family protein [Spirillospora sp. NPDC047279]|uniref:DUF2255 family protein n=1 Tax=Spirillospora sp. NPDC047279 TaxID=3155478 RepID=UPI0033D08E1C